MRTVPLLFLLSALSLGALPGPAAAGSKLAYKEGSTDLKGYLAGGDLRGLHPGVLIVHQWMGLGEHEKGVAERIAKELGYVALAADIYGAEAPKDMAEAGKVAGRFKEDRELYRRRVMAGLKTLQQRPNVDPRHLAVIGYCFGGAGALEMARSNAPVKGVVSFHGSLDAKEAATAPLRPKVLVLHGAADPYSDAKAVEALRQELKAAQADFRIVLYKGAVHAFTQTEAGDDPSKGAAYDAEADRKSWKAMTDFLKKLFRRG